MSCTKSYSLSDLRSNARPKTYPTAGQKKQKKYPPDPLRPICRTTENYRRGKSRQAQSTLGSQDEPSTVCNSMPQARQPADDRATSIGNSPVHVCGEIREGPSHCSRIYWRHCQQSRPYIAQFFRATLAWGKAHPGRVQFCHALLARAMARPGKTQICRACDNALTSQGGNFDTPAFKSCPSEASERPQISRHTR